MRTRGMFVVFLCVFVCLAAFAGHACNNQADERIRLINLYERTKAVLDELSLARPNPLVKPNGDDIKQAIEGLASIEKEITGLEETKALSDAQKRYATHLKKVVSLYAGSLKMALASISKSEFAGPVPDGVVIVNSDWPFEFEDSEGPVSYEELDDRYSEEILKEWDEVLQAIDEMNDSSREESGLQPGVHYCPGSETRVAFPVMTSCGSRLWRRLQSPGV
jgi:hypothetical protein